MDEFATRLLVRLPTVMGVDLSVTNRVVLLWCAALVTFAVLALACRRRGPIARGAFQNLVEAVVEFIESNVVRECIGEEGRSWSPFILATFFFVLFSNLLGLVPAPAHVQAVTANLSVTVGLALIVFATTVVIGVRRLGAWGFLKRFKPAGIPWWLAGLVVPIEVVSWLFRPLSLAVRLFANMVAGHSVIAIFVGMAAAAVPWLKPVPLLGAVAMSCFELFVCFVQAFIFSMLTALYIRDALEAH